MCAVIGFATDRYDDKDLEKLCRLWRESMIRGLHAWGMTVNSPRGAITVKGLQGEDPVVAMMRLWPFDRMIGHCRYSTSGDYEVRENNQPIAVGAGLGTVALAFNGVISMKEKHEYEKEFNVECDTDNDGEIAVRTYLRGGPRVLEDFVAKGKFSFAGLMFHNAQVYALRNAKRPLWFNETAYTVFVASTADIFSRAGFIACREVGVGRLWTIK